MENTGLKRLISQRVGGNHFTTASEVVDWLGAVQAQDLNSAKWAIGLRLPGSSEKIVDEAINDASIIRTHLLRPTWHFVSAANYPVFLALTAPNINSALKYRRIQLNLDDTLFAKSHPALEEMLRNGNHLTREEITAEMASIVPDLDSSKMNHILMEAEMNGLICSGRIKNRLPTYALSNERIEKFSLNGKFDKDNALKLLAGRYFRSHGPATLNDFIWWSGLSAGDCRKALAMVKDGLISEREESAEYWFDPSMHKAAVVEVPEIAMLPAFDEFIIAYKDRSAVITYENHGMAVSSNGVFRPVIVYDGQVIGLWTKTSKKETLIVSVKWFVKPAKPILEKLKESAYAYARFLGLKSIEIL
ncbi:MAG TPA: winged helix DNA-binding domain-containing protein [Lentimicrobium sp.]|nr:winged helix DNA-binding domain-containing protein [Lentimicrobium sp.]